jgi:orotate phosphoribosyltransferase
MEKEKNQLYKILKESIKIGDFTLKNKSQSKIYIDIKSLTTRPNTLRYISEYIIKKMKNHSFNPDYIACVELGSVPIGAVVSEKTNLPLIIIRKKEKDHGLIDNRLIGFEKGKDLPGMTILLEDVTTTGGSVLDAANVLKNSGLTIEAIISIVDREEGAKIAISGAGITFISLANLSGLLNNNINLKNKNVRY